MSFEPGSRLGPYEILSTLDIPGFGEAYRARDLELKRPVAMRLLRVDLAADPARLARLQQDAQAAVPLRHPNVLGLYDIGNDPQTAYIISEPVGESRTLRQALTLEGVAEPLPLTAAIQYAVQIAYALAAAHERRIVHRDLKPENILLSPDGRIRVAGFGIAEATQNESALAGGRGGSAPIGTPGYMSPEQVRGIPVDPRSDLFTFGAILYEMLTGTRAFSGETPVDTMTAVLKSDAPKLVRDVPPALARIVDLCLKKEPMARALTAADVANVLQGLLTQQPIGEPKTRPAMPPEPEVRATPAVAPIPPEPAWIAPPPAPAREPEAVREPEPAYEPVYEPAIEEPRPRRRWGRIAAVVGAIALLAAVWPTVLRIVQSTWDATMQPGSPSRTAPLATMTVPDRPIFEFAMAPDGQHVAFTAVDGSGKRRLWIRSTTIADEQPLMNTDNAAYPFWSPDSRFIAYFADGSLRKIPASGGMSEVVTDATAASPGAWNDDVILFSRDEAGGRLYRVPAAGGTASPVAGTAGDGGHAWPVVLPGGKVGYTVTPTGGGQPLVKGADGQTVLANASRAAFIEGYAFFLRDNALMVQPFDAAKLTTAGDAVAVGGGPGETVRAFSLSSAGILAYQTGVSAGPNASRIVWLDRTGAEVGSVGDPADYGDIRLSPDGKRLAVSVRAAGSTAADIALVDVTTGARTPFTSDPADDTVPVWSPDGRRLLFTSTRGGTRDVYVKAASGTGNDTALIDGQGDQIAYDWSSNGQYVLYQTNQPRVAEGGNFDLWARPAGGGRAFAYLRTIRAATRPILSPDRRWVAYTSVDGREDVYVSRFPRPDGRRRVSPRGGSWPRWRRDGDELFYVEGGNRLMAAPMRDGTPGTPVALFQLRTKADRGYSYDVAPDGQRILVNMAGGGDKPEPIKLVDWRARVAGSR